MIVGVDRVPERGPWSVSIFDEERHVVCEPRPGSPCDVDLDEGVEMVLEARLGEEASPSSDRLIVRLRARHGGICPPYRLGGPPIDGRGGYDLIVYVTDAEQVAPPRR